jgi:hypothetical protein
MKKNSSEDIYNVNKYTDIELFQILDLINPSDRELEAKIIQLMNKYQTIKNDSGSQLYRFFNDIYNHFFDNSDDEIVEGLDERSIVYSVPESQQNSATNPIINPGTNAITYGNSLGFGNTVVSGNTLVSGNAISYGNTTVGKTIDVNTDYRKDDVTLTKPLDYSKDVLNPLLKQTVRRIISIDSSYRPNSKDSSTDFTFNLSEPLRDVLSLKLYSVQIPYSWYTISNQYGSNFFYLKGNSDGINNGDHDYQIKINSGNYDPITLIQAINTEINKIADNNPSVDFGSTSVSCDRTTIFATFNIDITKLYNESNYYLYFPNWTTPNTSEIRNNSIPGFLGFNYQTYIPSAIYSTRTLPLTPTSTTDSDYLVSDYNVNSSNCYFTIKKYTGYSEYSNTSEVIWSHVIAFNTDNISNAGYSRQSLYNDLNTQLQNDPYLINSYIERLNIPTNSSLDGAGFSFYKLFIQLNPNTTSNVKDSKTIVIFPNENVTSGNKKIWTGDDSCFSFKDSNNELNNVVSETQTLQTNYIINSSPSILLKCIKTYYGVTINNVNYTTNNYLINIQNSPTIGYTLDEYINAINNAFVLKNQNTIDSTNINGDFNMPNGNNYTNSNTNVTISNSKIRFSFDINKKFDETKYIVDFRNTFFLTKFGISGVDLDLSLNNVFTGSFQSSSSYTIDTLQQESPSYLMIIKPKSDPYPDFGNKNAPIFNVPPFYASKTYTNFKQMEFDINLAFSNFRDDDGDYVLAGTNILLNNINGTIDVTLTIKVTKILTQNDYQLIFNEPASNGLWNSTDVNNTWYKYLNILQSTFNLNDYLVEGKSYAHVYGSAPIFGNKITLLDNYNNYFYIKPLPNANGVYTETNKNDIKITITPGVYTRPQLLEAMNTLLANNSITTGSSITIVTINGIEYTKFRFNINKIFTANDYRLVFYDPYSFVRCYVGSKSAKNTTWDSTIGWVLGFRTYTEYNLIKSNEEADPNDETKVYYLGSQSYYSSNTSTNIVSISGDAAVIVNLYNYFLIVLDDYTQSHLNDGLVTITSTETDIPLPSYATRNVATCDVDNNPRILFTGNSVENENVNFLTQREIYATNAKIASRKNKIKSYSSGPFIKDIFGLIPIKTAGLGIGSVYTEFGGTLQNQDRTYFGPVNIQRMSVKLMNERGDVVDLNNTNWSFSLMCEQLYQQSSL